MTERRGTACRFCHSPIRTKDPRRVHVWSRVPCRRIQELEDRLRMALGELATREEEQKRPLISADTDLRSLGYDDPPGMVIVGGPCP